MPRKDGRIEKGQSLKSAISARAWNRAQDAADLVLGVNSGATEGDPPAFDVAPNIALVRNDSGITVPVRGVLSITGVAISPVGGTISGTNTASANAREFLRRPVLAGIKPSQAGSQSIALVSHIGIAMEPVAAGSIGRFAVGGVIACKIKLVNFSHRYARGRANDVTQLISAGCGPVKLLWRENATGDDKWAVGVL